jgi:murein DD-endopeptidase MepM/ murein hydrolase activator NlpD
MRFILFTSIACISFYAFLPSVFAQTADDLRDEIRRRTQAIAELNEEIKQYEGEVNRVSQEANTLSNTVKAIVATEKKLETDVAVTSKKVERASYSIRDLEQGIREQEASIERSRAVLAEMMRRVQKTDDATVFEILLSQQTLSEFFKDVDTVAQFQGELKVHVDEVRELKAELEGRKVGKEEEKRNLEGLREELKDRESIVEQNRKEKDQILKETRNQEANYRKILADKVALKNALDQEIRDYESKLRFILDPKSIPAAQPGVLSWPVENVFITQMFGRTVSAKRLYVSGSHSGTDFRASTGTPIFSVADGVVEGVGDTDVTCRGASFGKWVFIRHDNGLATAYGHLSLGKVREGQRVNRGDVIAYSGNTGHSTAPHLHLTVYASFGAEGEEGARVATRPSKACLGHEYRMPLAPIDAYLDPMDYLPRASADMIKSSAY